MNTELLDIYTDYLISQNHYATATGLAAMLNGEISLNAGINSIATAGLFSIAKKAAVLKKLYF